MLFTDGEDLQNAVLHAPIGICILNADTLVAEVVNDKFLEIAGKSFDAISGQHYWDAFAEVRSSYEAALDGVVKTGESYYADEVEMKLIRHGKEEMIFVTFVYSPVKNKAEKVTKVAVWVLENTRQVVERKKEESEKILFQKESDRFRSIFMQAPAGICILRGPQLVYDLVNPAYQQFLPGRDLLGRPIFDALPELIGTPLEEILNDVYRKGEPYAMNEMLVPIAEYEGGPTHDRYFNFSYQPWRDEHDHVDGIVVIAFDVSGIIDVQKQLQAAREQADQQKRVYETIMSGTPDLMYVWDLNYRFTYANKALLTMWGKTWDTAIGVGLRENGYEEWHARMHEREIDHVIATKESVRGEVAFPHATQGKRIYDYILIPVLNDQGEVEAVAGTTRDVTERKLWEEKLSSTSEELQAINEELASSNEELVTSNDELVQIQRLLEEETAQRQDAIEQLQKSEQQVRSIVAAAPFPIGVYTGREMRITMVNQTIMNIWGKGNDVIGKTYHEVLPELADTGIYQQLDRVFTTGEEFHARNQRVDLVVDGELQPFYFNYSFTPLYDPDGKIYGVMNTAAELTDLVRAKQQVEQSEQNLQAVIAQAPVAMCILNGPDHVITVANQLMVELWGKPRAEVMNKPVFDALPDARDQGLEAIMNDVYLTGKTFYASELPVSLVRHGQPEVVYQNFVYQAYKDANGAIAGVIAITIDVTEQVLARKTIEQSAAELHDIKQRLEAELEISRELEQQKDGFIGMASHELKTPLTSLSALLQVANLKLKNSEDPFLASAMEKSNMQVRRMTDMINSFLNISRLESGKIHIEKQAFDLVELINETIAEASLIASRHQIHFAESPPVQVNADRDKIGSVISNLINNAVKYSPHGKNIDIDCEIADDKVIVSVKDEGMGIMPSDLDKIFDRYYRVQTKDTHYIAGFGIGLYLSTEIVERHGGKVWAESEFGKGSVFYFSLLL